MPVGLLDAFKRRKKAAKGRPSEGGSIAPASSPARGAPDQAATKSGKSTAPAFPRFQTTAGDQVDRGHSDPFATARLKLRVAFTPSQPVADSSRFAGRREIVTALIRAIEDISAVVNRETLVAIISTVVPGTVRRYIRPAVSPLLRLCYNPFFIAMGTTMRDFLQSEFVLLGVDDAKTAKRMAALYGTVTDAPVLQMSIESAELTKVAYNTFIGMKIVFANTLMEICHKSPGANVLKLNFGSGKA